MPRTLDELERAAADAEVWLDALSSEYPSAVVDKIADLRRVGFALQGVADAESELAEAVAAARVNGRSWGRIAMVLGVSRQAAQKRYGEPARH